MKIYLDNCCFNRPYDEQTHDIVRLETEAKLMVQEAIHGGKLKLVWSFMLDFENSVNPYDDQREAIAEWKNLSDEFVAIQDSIREKAKQIETYDIKSKDALHLACAIAGGCEYFLTTDRHIIKKALPLKEIKTINPVGFFYILEE